MILKATSYLFFQLRRVNRSYASTAFRSPATICMRCVFWACMAAFALFSTATPSGCTPLQDSSPSPLNVFIPSHPPVVTPGHDTPPQVAALAGAWEGIWSDGDPSALLVLDVDSYSARILLACNNYNDELRLPWHQWAQAQLAQGAAPRLEWKTPKAQFSFELSSDGQQLMGISQGAPPSGRAKTITITMTRRKIQPLMVDRPEPPCTCKAIGEELRRIELEQDPSARSALTNALINRATRTGTPLLETGSKTDHSCATFLYSGKAKTVALAGDMNGWNEQKDTLVRVAGTDLYVLSQEYPSDARLEYKLVVNGEMILDPLNSRTSVYGRGANSEAPMPMFIPPREILQDPAVPGGTVEEWMIGSKQPDMARTATIYLPAGYAGSSDRYPVLYLNDAFGVLKFGKMVVILDNIIGWKVIQPVIAVMLPSVKDRIAEYSMNPAFEAFVVEEVVPAVDARYRTRPFAEFRAIGGISAGATAALSLAIRHPEVFGNCIAQSTATNLVPLLQLAKTGPSRPISVYLDVGSFEADFYGRDLVDSTRRLRESLLGHKCSVLYKEVNQGHGWASWRTRTRDAFTFLYSAPDSEDSVK